MATISEGTGEEEVNAIDWREGPWEKIDVTVDSGAMVTVFPPKVGKGELKKGYL